jgi:hypothetical protein
MGVAISPIAARSEVEEGMSEALLVDHTAFHWVVGFSRLMWVEPSCVIQTRSPRFFCASAWLDSAKSVQASY